MQSHSETAILSQAVTGVASSERSHPAFSLRAFGGSACRAAPTVSDAQVPPATLHGYAGSADTSAAYDTIGVTGARGPRGKATPGQHNGQLHHHGHALSQSFEMGENFPVRPTMARPECAAFGHNNNDDSNNNNNAEVNKRWGRQEGMRRGSTS